MLWSCMDLTELTTAQIHISHAVSRAIVCLSATLPGPQCDAAVVPSPSRSMDDEWDMPTTPVKQFSGVFPPGRGRPRLPR